MSFRAEYNGCKTYGCPNCGNPDLSLYSRSDRLGYDAWLCSECGSYPPVLLNLPIIALAEQTRVRQLNNSPFRACGCKQPHFQRYGFTASGSQRVQCTVCRQVITLPNSLNVADKLQPIMSALVNRVPPESIQETCGISRKEFSKRIDQLSQLLAHVSRQWETNINFSFIQTRATIQICRSGLQHSNSQQKETHLWTLSSADSATGYMLLLSDNALYTDTTLSSEVLHQSLYHLNEIEMNLTSDTDVLSKAELTYSKILSRSQFDKLAYCLRRNAKSKDAKIIRPVYAAHAHFQNLHLLLNEMPPSAFILEHESFLRGAAITAFSEEIRKGQTDLYYCHLTELVKSLKLPATTKTISWWNEKWYRLLHEVEYGSWSVGIGVLTKKKSKLSQLLPSHPNWNQYFWDGFNNWLTPEYTRRISLKRLHQWQTIYQYLYNFVLTDRANIKAKYKVDPGQINSIVKALNHQKLSQSLNISDYNYN